MVMRRRNFLAPGSMGRFIENTNAFESFCAQTLTKDGLLHSSHLSVTFNPDGYELSIADHEEIAVFPFPECDLVTDFLVGNQDLWRQAAIHVRSTPSIWGSMPVFGVPFRRAVEVALERGHIKSKFFLPDQGHDGVYKTLLLHFDRSDDVRGKLLQLQAWQYSPGGSHAHYIHALSTDFKDHVCHLDGATIQYTDADLEILLRQSRKVKGFQYQKHFRLDGLISIENMHRIAVAFLPGDELYREAFECDVLERRAHPITRGEA